MNGKCEGYIFVWRGILLYALLLWKSINWQVLNRSKLYIVSTGCLAVLLRAHYIIAYHIFACHSWTSY